MVRFLAFLILISCTARGQIISGIATPYDGSAVYFASKLRIKGSNQPSHGKLFVADENGVRLFRSRIAAGIPPSNALCGSGPFYSFTSVHSVSRDGLVAAGIEREATGCSAPPVSYGSSLLRPNAERDIAAFVNVSPSGRFAIVITRFTGRSWDLSGASFLDTQSGTETPISLPKRTVAYETFGLVGGSHAISDDGIAILRHYPAGMQSFLVRPGGDPQPFPVPEANPLAISADGTQVLYDLAPMRQLRLFDLKKQADYLVTNYDQPIANAQMSDDAQRIVFQSGNRWYIVQADGGARRVLLDETVQATSAVLSGNGKVLYALTSLAAEGMRVITMDVDRDEQVEIIGPTPFVVDQRIWVDAGLIAGISGGGFSRANLLATPPLNSSLGGVAVRVGERPAPIFEAAPDRVRFQVPWDTPASSNVPVVIESSSQSPFDFPETYLNVNTRPRAGAIAHQNWEQLRSGAEPVRRGEIIHVWAVGLGAVTPEVPPGALAPLAGPLSYLSQRLECDHAEVLFAGRVPGSLETIYQVDLRIGDVTGYTHFECKIGQGAAFRFLSLAVSP